MQRFRLKACLVRRRGEGKKKKCGWKEINKKKLKTFVCLIGKKWKERKKVKGKCM